MKNTVDTINIDAVAEAFKAEERKKVTHRIVVCAGTGCIANGALKVFDALKNAIAERGLPVVTELKLEDTNQNPENATHMAKSGCQGFCAKGPLVSIYPEDIMYLRVKPEDVNEILEQTIVGGEVVERLLYKHPKTGEICKAQNDIPFYKRQHRNVLKACGSLDAESLEEYIASGGYQAARKALTTMEPIDVCESILESGLRGRGGGGFPTGLKWKLTLKEENEKKYVICNGDEGDPGAFMDRSLMEGNPHGVLEGMILAAHAIGANEGVIYVRLEYPLAVKRMRKAIKDATAVGLLGDNLFGTGKAMNIWLMEGAGAFVCGEETALIASVEGKRGMPMPKPPFPAQSGLWGKPTLINNVETLATIPLIISNGPSWFNSIGTENSKGTKTFALTGHVVNSGLIEVPFGTTLREIVYEIGGGLTDDEGTPTDDSFKAVQIGGPSGGCLTEAETDMPLDYDNLIKAGAMVGSGGLVVMNNQSCMVQIARFFMEFTQNESCGKCVPCREGTKQMLSLLDDILEGKADQSTVESLDILGRVIKKGSLCGLGKTAPGPVISTMTKFAEEYRQHIENGACMTNKCQALRVLTIDNDKCRGCTVCARKCPVNAISGEKKGPHHIDAEKCTKCGICIDVCKFDAVVG